MIVTLLSNNYQVTINSLGAELKSMKNPDGKEYVWNSDPAFWMRSSPLLFPTVGNVRDNQTLFLGKKYDMPKHGFCKDSEFEVVFQNTSNATFRLNANEETRSHYPFQFELTLTYQLNGPTLSLTYEVTNKDNNSLPYQIGAHPGFMCPLEKNEKITDYQLEFEKEERLEATVYDLEKLCFSDTKKKLFAEKSKVLPLQISMFDQDAVFFPHTASHQVKLINPVTRNGISIYYPDFASIAFWTPAGCQAPFLCIEPWNGAAIYENEDNIFCHNRDVHILKKNDSKKYHLSISILE